MDPGTVNEKEKQNHVGLAAGAFFYIRSMTGYVYWDE